MRLSLRAMALSACGGSETTTTTTKAADDGETTTTAADDGETTEPTGETLKVGIAMPTKSSERWIDDGNNIDRRSWY